MPLRSTAVPGNDARPQALSDGAAATEPPNVERIAEVASTNSELIERVRAAVAAGEALAPRFLVADRQTAGRGRHGRTWHATPGASIALSVAWPFRTDELAGLSLAVGVAVADALDPLDPRAARDGARIGLKWPNDLLLVDRSDPAALGRKLAGILVETVPGGGGRVAVIGVGVNVRACALDAAGARAASVDEFDPQATPESVLRRLVAALSPSLRRFAAAGFEPFAARFAARDALRGRRLRARVDGSELEGTAAGVSAGGELIVETPQARVFVSSGELQVLDGGPMPATPGVPPAGRSARAEQRS